MGDEGMNNVWAEITFEELQEAAKPLVQLLRDKGNPHTTAIVTVSYAEIMKGIAGCVFQHED